MTSRGIMRAHARTLAGGLLALILGGCASILPHAPSPRAMQEEHQAHAQRAHPWAPLTRSRQPYLIGTGFALRAHRPVWLRQTVTVRTARPVLIYQAAELIARAAGVPVSVRALGVGLVLFLHRAGGRGVRQDRRASPQYQGEKTRGPRPCAIAHYSTERHEPAFVVETTNT